MGLNPGSLVGGTTYGPGRVDQAFSFDGVGAYIDIPHSPSIFFADDHPFTVEAWFKPESEGASFFILKNAAYGLRWQGSTSPLAFYNGNYHYSTKASWTLNQWYHVALMDDGSTTVRLYINGLLDKSDDGTLRNPNRFPCHPSGAYCFPLQLGGVYETQSVEYFQGQLDEVTLYDRALTSSEIDAIYQADSSGKCHPEDADGDGFPVLTDCDDSNPAVFPGAPELCDGLDNNCDETVDSFPTMCGVGVCASAGMCVNGTDSCAPGQPSPEVCDGLDNNCDGLVDNGAVPCCVTPPSSIVAWWSGDGNAHDLVGSNNGTPVGGASFAPGMVGQAFSFDGVDDGVRVPNAAALDFSGDFSIEAWIYPTEDRAFGHIVEKGGTCGSAYSFHTLSGRGLRFAVQGGCLTNYLDAYGVLTIQAWNHVAAVFEQPTGTRILYVNGVEVLRRSDPGVVIGHTTSDVGIGIYSLGGLVFPGMIDEVTLYSKALSALEINAIYQSGSSGKCHPEDADGDGFPVLTDCDDSNPTVFPGAPQWCDGLNNDCSDPAWPAVPADETDPDDDSYVVCLPWIGSVPGVNGGGDCAPNDPAIYPGASEVCNGIDDNCDGLPDNDVACLCVPGKLGMDVIIAEPTAGIQSLVWTGSEFGVAWSDRRNGEKEIYFARLDPHGARLTGDLRVTTAPGDSVEPRLVWTGTEYGLAWQDRRNGSPDLFFTRLDRLGNKISEDILISIRSVEAADLFSEQLLPSVVWTGSNYAIAWHDFRVNNWDIFFVLLDSSGLPVGPIMGALLHPAGCRWLTTGLTIAGDGRPRELINSLTSPALDGHRVRNCMGRRERACGWL